MRIGGKQGVEFLDETVVLEPVWLHECFKQRERGSDCALLPPLDPFEEGRTPRSVARVVLDKIDQDVGVETDLGMASKKGRGDRSFYQEARSRFR